MNILDSVVKGVCRLVLWVSTLVIFLILACNTILRYVTGSSLQWANEVPELLFPWLVMSGVVLAAAHGAHITTTFLVETLPAGLQRIIATLSWGVVAMLYGVLTYSTFNMLEIVHDERSQILGVPGSVTYTCVMVGMAMLALLALQSAVRAWVAGSARNIQMRNATAGTDSSSTVANAHW